MINAAEAGQDIPVTGKVTGEFNEDDTVTLTVNEKPFTGTVDKDGNFSINVPGADLVADGDKVIDASITTTDKAGNTDTATTSEGYSVDTEVTDLAIELDANITEDDVINAAEAGQDIPVTGKVTGEFNEDDTVTLTVNEKPFTGTVDKDGNFSINVPGADLVADGDKVIDASITTTDKAGNTDTATTSEGYSVDTEVTDLAIELDANITEDDVINAAEAGQDIPVTGKVTGEFNEDDTVTLTVNEKPFTGTVDKDGNFSINVPGADLVADGDKVIDASITTTDKAGNTDTATTSEGYSVDTEVTDLAIELDANITEDDVINAAEAGQDIPVTGKVTGEFNEDDTVTLTVNEKPFTGTVDKDGNFSINVPGADLVADGDKVIDASITTTDKAGNTDTATTSEGYSVDTEVTDLAIELDANITEDDVINAAEAGQDIPVTGKVTGEFNEDDTVTLTVNEKPFTGTVDKDGNFSINVPGADLVADGDKVIDASITTTDKAGNTDTATTSEGYSVDTEVTDLAIELDANITEDDVINAAEAGQDIPVTGKVTGEFNEDDTVTLTVNEKPFTGTVDKDGNFSINVPGADLVADGDKVIDASITTTDKAGNTDTATTSEGYSVDTEVTDLAIELDANITEDDVINAAEAGQDIPVTGKVTGEFNEDDTVTLTVNEKPFTGTVDKDGNFSINVPGADLVADGDKVIDASITTTDKAGNTDTATTSEGYSVDTEVTDLAIELDANITEDDVINAAEAGQDIPVTGKVTGEFNEDDTVTLTVNEKPFTGTVDKDGNFSINVPGADLVADGDKVIDASITTTDKAGNTDTATTSEGYSVDTEVTDLAIELDANITEDDVINAAEAGQDIPVTGKVTGEFNEDDTVTLTVNEKPFTGTVDKDGNFSINVPGADLVADGDKVIDASITTTDKAGNTDTATTSEGYSVDTEVTDLAIELDANITEDDVINAAEAGQDIPVTGKVTGEFNEDDTVTLTVNEKPFTGTVDKDGNFSINVPGADLVADGDKVIDASITTTDKAGNTDTATTSEGYSVDTEVTDLAIELDANITEDDVINAAEAGQDIPVTGKVTGEFNEDDTVTLTVNEKPFTGTVDKDGNFSINVPGADLVADGDKVIDASITTTDKAGNTDTATTSEGYSVDTEVTDLAIELDANITEDDVINAAEAGQDIPVTGKVTGEFNEDDTVTLTVNEKPFTGTVDKDGNFSINVPGADLVADGDKVIDASITTTDKAGNTDTATTSEGYSVDTEVTDLAIELDANITEDDVINAAEAGQDIPVTGKVTGEFNEDDTVTLTVNEKPFTGTVDKDGNFSINVPGADLVADGDKVIDASITTTDKAGNTDTATTSEGYSVDTEVTDLAIELDANITEDDVINAAEAGQDIPVTGKVTGEFNEDDTVTLTVNEKPFTGTVDKDGNFSINVPGADLVADGDKVIDASITTTDKAGNTDTATTSEGYSVDTEVTDLAIELDANITEDDVINAAEAGQDIPVTGKVTGEFNEDDTVTLTVNEKPFTGTVDKDGNFSINVPGADLVADGDKVIDASITTTDKAGNTDTATTSEGYSVDTEVTDLAIELDANITEDDVINAAEAGQDIPVTGKVTGEFNEDDTVTLTVNEKPFTGTVDKDGNFSINVPGADLVADGDKVIDASITTTDKAGNTDTATTSEGYSVDTEVTDLAIELDANITEDDVINAAEAGQDIPVTGKVTGEFNEDDTVTLTVNEKPFTGTVDKDGNFSINVPGADLVADGDKVIDASITTTDKAGNTDTATTSEGYSVDTEVTDLAIELDANITEDDVINAAEAGQDIPVTGKVTGEFNEDDTVTLTVNEKPFTGTVDKDGNFSINVPGADLVADGDKVIDASITTTDKAGNTDTATTSEGYSVDTEVTDLAIELDANITEDDVINAAEAGQDIPVTGKVTGEFNEDDTVTLTVNEKPFTGTVDKDGNFSINVPGADLVADGDKVIDASITTTDKAGNTDTATTSEGYSVDTEVTDLAIELDANITEDDVINAAEAGQDIPVTGKVTGEFNEDDTVTLTVNEKPFTGTVDKDGNFSINVPGADLVADGDKVIDASITTTDKAGNTDTATTSEGYSVDTEVTDLAIELDANITEDDVINAAEAGQDIPVTGKVTGEFNEDDTVTLTVNEKPFTGTVDKDGNFSINVPGADLVADGDKVIDASITTTDKAGNTDTATTSEGYSVDTEVTDLAIELDANITEDDVINAAEAGQDIPVTGKVTGEFNEDDTVTLTVNEKPFTGTVDKDGNFSINVPGADLVADGDKVIDASITTTDKAGNTDTATTSEGYSVDTEVTDLAIELDANITEDDVINAAEAGQDIPVTGKVTGEFNEDDTVTLTVNEKPFTGTVDKDGNFSINVPGADLVADGDKVIDASITTTDKAGNTDTATTSEGYSVDTEVTDLAIELDANITEDDVINAAEAGQDIPVTGKVTGEFNEDDTVTLTVNEKPFTGTVDKDGNFSINVPGADLVADGDKVIDASITTTDKAGNTDTATTSEGYSVDTEVTDLAIELDANITEDDVINAAEAGQDIPVTGKVTGEFNEDDTVTLTVNEKPFTGTVDKDGNFSINVPGADLVADGDKVIDASITTTDKAGNTDTATTSEGYSVDTEVTDLAIELDANITEDDVINAAEAGQDIPVTGKVTGEFNEDDTVTLTVNEKPFTGTVDKDGNFSINVPGADLVADGDKVIDASITTTDKAGNTDTATTSEGYSVDTEVTDLAIELDANITEDDVINAAEAGQDIPVTGKVTGEFNEDDTVTLTVNEKPFTGTVDKDGNFSINVPGADLVADGDKVIDASITTTDKAGNTDTATTSEGYSVDTEVTDLAIELDANITEDDVINAAEAGQDIPVTGKVTGEFNEDDTVTLTVNEKPFTGTVDKDGNFSINVPGADLVADGDKVIDASITTTDKAGNTDTATTSEGYSVDTEVTDLAIELDANITEDDVINAAEAGQDIPVTGKVTGEFNEDDTVTLTVNEKPFTGTVDKDGNFSINVPGADLVADGDKVIDASITTTDKAGNTDTATTSEGYSVDTEVTDLAIELDANITEDDVINAAEAGQDIPVTGKVTGEFNEDDTVTLTVNEKPFTGTVDKDGNFSINVPGADLVADGDKVIDASITTTDKAGNTDTATTSEGYSVDTEVTDLAIELDANITEDDVINAAEAGQDIPVTGKVTGEFNEDDTVTLTVNEKPFTGTVDKDGNFSINVPGADLVADGDKVIDASITTTDKAGNTDTATTSEGYSVDTEVTDLAIELDANITEDDVINAAEAGQDIPVTGKVTGEFNEDDTVTLTVNEKPFTGTVDKDGNFSINVPGADLVADGDKVIDASITTTDKAGNTDTATTSEGYSVDTEVTDLAIELDANITEDDVINAAEAGQDIPVTGKVTGEFNEDDTVTLTVNEKPFTGTVDKDGNFSINVPGADLVADGDKVIDASITTTDKAGNTDTATTSEGYSVDNAPDAIDDTLTITSSGLKAEYYGYQEGADGNNLSRVHQVESFIQSNDPDATFIASKVNYGSQENNLGTGSTLQKFLKGDKGSLSNDPGDSSDAIIRMSGQIELSEGTYQFKVKADDGYSIRINGEVVAEYDGNQSATSRKGIEFTVDESGSHNIEIIYWDQGGDSQLKVQLGEQNSSGGFGNYKILGEDITSHEQPLSVDDGQSLTIDPAVLLANDQDESPESLQVIGVGNPVHGSVSMVNGQIVFTPDPNYSGPAQFDYTVVDEYGQQDSATVTLNVVDTNDAPTVSAATVTVSEEGLAQGIEDGQGLPDTTDSPVASGKLTISDPDSSDLSVTLTAPTVALTSGGQAIEWSGDNTNVLVGSVDGQPVIEISIDDEGNYDVTLSGPVDHPVQGEDRLAIEVGVNVHDGELTGQSTLTIQVEDDAPESSALTEDVEVTPTDSNIVVVLDVSGSMGGNRLTMAKSAISNLLDSYDEHGDVKVQVVTFSGDATAASQWLDVAEAKQLVNAAQADGWTNYDAALFDSEDGAKAAFETQGSLPNGQNLLYFLSDGAPNYGYGLGSADEVSWETYLNNHDIKAYALGIGNGVSVSQLDRVAFDGTTNSEMDAQVVTDVNDLSSVLNATAAHISGNLVQDTSRSGQLDVSQFGADGGYISAVTVDGKTYHYSPVGGITGATGAQFNANTNELTIETTAKGKWTIDLDNGAYSYTAPAGAQGAFSESLDYVLTDSDGDTADSSLTLNVKPADNQAPVANDDVVELNVAEGEAVYLLRENDYLVKLDPESGTGATIAKVNVDTLAMGQAGDLLGTYKHGNSAYLVEISKETGAITSSLQLSGVSGRLNALCVGDDGLLIASNDQGIYQIDPTTGQSSQLSNQHTFDDLSMLGGQLYGVDNGKLYLVDIDGSQVSRQQLLDFGSSINGLATTADGQLIIAATNSYVYRYDPQTGNGEWMHTYDGSTNSKFADAAGDALDVTGNVLENDSDAEGSALTVTDVAFGTTDGDVGSRIEGNHGYLELNADGRYRYTLTDTGNADSLTDEVFTYTITDGSKTDTAQLVIKLDALTSIKGADGDDNISVLAGEDRVQVDLGAYFDSENKPVGTQSYQQAVDESEGVMLKGGAGNDHLTGGLGNDILIGGTNGHGSSGGSNGGNQGDTLSGGEGRDTFVWLDGDAGDFGQVGGSIDIPVDIITDFNTSSGYFDASEGDTIDLSDLLDSDGGKSKDELESLLSALEVDGDTHLQINVDGSSDDSVDQTIVLENTTFDDITGISNSSANDVINHLFNNNLIDLDK
ncbi:Ig-like domain-containing protein [Photobacterium atrarenae]|uniref:Ig-like domain-containing protein n=1 Tax=Photobacterium atrarenae TaxID=865757 RepID=A0ABY5GHK1_9GAMM|nr:Ig-like domain-containing protein [Photobacterium atrarenae]